MSKLKLIETIQTKLPTLSKTDGQLIVVRDNASLHIDLDGNRIYISDWIDIETDTDRLAMLTPLNNKYYYVVETNKIWRYISGSWVLVTRDYVESTRTIAGIDLKDDITVDELSSALGVDTKAEQTDLESHTSNKSNPHEVTKIQVGLGNVDNTSDINKPISNATQIELDKKTNQEDFDILSESVAYLSDDTEVITSVGTVLTTQNIIDNVDSSLNNMVLSAKQGKMLNERITNILTNNGNIDASTEVLDIRVDTKGTTHASAGDAVRSQISELSSEIAEMNDLYVYGDNRLELVNITNDKYITVSGKIADYAGWSLSDYIPIEPNTDYVWIISANAVASNNYYCFYDKNKNYLSGGNGGNKIVGVDNAYYLRISNATSCFNDYASIVPYDKYYNSSPYPQIPFTRELRNAKVIEVSDIENELRDNNVNVKSINRLGIRQNAPIQSKYAYIDAYKMGFRTLLCDLCFTSDNVPVCSHDMAINQHYQNVCVKGTHEVVDFSTNPIYLHVKTYQHLIDTYDWGYLYSANYENLPLLTFDEMVKLCKYLGCELYVEVKFMRENNVQSAIEVLRKYNFKNVVWSGTAEQMQWVLQYDNSYRVSTMPMTIDETVIAELVSLKTGNNEVFAFMDSSTEITADMVDMLIENGIGFEMGTLNTEQAIFDYIGRGSHYNYCSGIESDSIIASEVLKNHALSEVHNS